MFYFHIKDNQIIGKGECKCLSLISVEVSEDVYNDYEQYKYIYQNDKIVLNPDYDEIIKQQEKERIQALTCTKRVFALALQEIGVTYSALKELIASNEQAQLEWDLSERLLRSNPLIDTMASELGVTSEQIDEIFKKANEG